ncbi:DUF4249 domain-containing protein [Spirosoma fluviale]|uniref:DUF4249 domain-containing protein n=1 Tax=Spirosoma fluviale TaxID=1597977 RepID=A0A286FAU0_9BACT|nr:DUF4249 domain-containing protein [Spirosoma fluviale]SOD79964.1 protein of unknown function [Spirosoma fluviale]
MKNTPINILAWLLILLVGGCVDPYRPPEVASPNSYLVVNGFFDSAPGAPTTIRLSRTQNLADTKAPTVETKAVVTIESQNKAIYTLAEGAAGTYTLAGVTPRTGENYRLHIRTTKGVEYFSAYVPVIQTPPIDSVSWRKEDNGVQINVNAHDATNNTRYYRWEFDETWEYYSAFTSSYELINNQLVDRAVRVDQCWSNASSTNIMTTSTARLSQDVVSQFPLTFIPGSSIKLGVKYSILVRQIALSQTGFDYYDQLAKITQNIGSIFDPQPSQITGNLYCANNSNELVLGFFRVGSVATKRLFISRSQIPDFRAITSYESCTTDTLTLAEIRKDQPAVVTLYDMTRYLTTSTYCVDCRLRGGVIKRPDFWQ